jgi:hypothetical protein
VQQEDGSFQVSIESKFDLTTAEARAAFQLRQNVEAFVEHWGREHCAFFTLTDKDGLHPTVFARRFHNYIRREGGWILAYVRVLEPQRNGRPHYHLLVATPWDMQPDAFDWQAFAEAEKERVRHGYTAQFRTLRHQYVASAAPEVRAMWKRLRDVLPRYGLGRAEFLPVRKGAGALCEYIGKYLEKGFMFRKHEWKGVRRVEYDRRNSVEWKRCSRVFAWVSPKAKRSRERVAFLASVLGLREFDEIKRVLGRRWAYRLRGVIATGSDEELRAEVMALAAERVLHRVGSGPDRQTGPSLRLGLPTTPKRTT